MNGLRRVTRPLPYLDERPLERLWAENELSPGRVVVLGAHRYRVLGWDPIGVRPGRVYLEELGSGRQHALVVRDGQD